MPLTYQIKDWDRHFENAKSRTIDSCSFVCIPNKQHGLGFTRIMAEADGAAIFGIWCLLLEIASRQKRPRNGWLTDDGKQDGAPLTSEDLALRWRRPEQEVHRALTFLSSTKIGWIEAHHFRSENGTTQSESLEPTLRELEVSAEYPPGSQITERTEQKEIERTEEKKPQRAVARSGCRIPDGFSASDEIREFAKIHAPDVDLSAALAEFVDYWIGIPGQRGRKLDWNATFRNRLRDLQARTRKNGNSNGSYQQDLIPQRSSGSVYEFKSKTVIR
jgi:hypothetical protein